MITINAVNSTKGMRYYVTWDGGSLHILNHKSLDYHLKKVVGLSKVVRAAAIRNADTHGSCTISADVVAA